MLWAAVAAVALPRLRGCCLDHWWYAHGRIVDTPFYQGYGLQMRNGLLPYRDFSVEYPPGALPVFLAPTYFGQPTVLVDYAALVRAADGGLRARVPRFRAALAALAAGGRASWRSRRCSSGS